MAEPAYYLTEADRAFLEDLYRRFGNPAQAAERPETRNPRARSPYQPPLEATHGGPRCYVALTPAGGLPALERYGTTGTGSSDAIDDTPGEAECEIYAIDETPGTSGMARLDHLTGLTKTVYNLGNDAVGGGRWIGITRTERGAWIRSGGAAETTGGGGGGGEGAGEVTDPTYVTAQMSAGIFTLSGGNYHAHDDNVLTIPTAGFWLVLFNTYTTNMGGGYAAVTEETYGGGPASGSVTFIGPGADNTGAESLPTTNRKAFWRVDNAFGGSPSSLSYVTLIETTDANVRLGIWLVSPNSSASYSGTPTYATGLTAVKQHDHA